MNRHQPDTAFFFLNKKKERSKSKLTHYKTHLFKYHSFHLHESQLQVKQNKKPCRIKKKLSFNNRLQMSSWSPVSNRLTAISRPVKASSNTWIPTFHPNNKPCTMLMNQRGLKSSKYLGPACQGEDRSRNNMSVM